MNVLPNYLTCIELHLQHHSLPQVIDHVIFTTQTALSIVKELKALFPTINCQLVLAGAMLHDIGRSQSHNIDHGIIGGEIIKQHGFPVELVYIVENHIFAGILKDETYEFSLPAKEYLPSTIEEKIVAYSDNISKNLQILSREEVLNYFSKYLSMNHPVMRRINKLHEEIETYLKISRRE